MEVPAGCPACQPVAQAGLWQPARPGGRRAPGQEERRKESRQAEDTEDAVLPGNRDRAGEQQGPAGSSWFLPELPPAKAAAGEGRSGGGGEYFLNCTDAQMLLGLGASAHGAVKSQIC